MIADVRERLEKVPFVPFVIRTSDGHEYAVPTVDHAFITLLGNRVVVVADNARPTFSGRCMLTALLTSRTASSRGSATSCLVRRLDNFRRASYALVYGRS